MGSVNVCMFIGNLGRDAEVRYTTGGAAVAKFSIACTEVWTDKSGTRQERTEWVNCELWGKQAESLAEYLTKGKQVHVQGRLQTDDYTDKEGAQRKFTKVRVDRVVLLGGGNGGDRAPARDRARMSNDEAQRGTSTDPNWYDANRHGGSDDGLLDDSDIPF